MSYQPVSGIVPQYSNDSNELASGFYLKFYEANTTTPLSMATDADGGTLLVKCKLNPNGLPISNPLDNETVFIPHVDQAYRLVIYRNAADADANNTAAAFVNVPDVDPLASAESVNNRVIRVSSRTEMKAYDVPAGYKFLFEGYEWVVKSGTPPSDPEEGVYVVLTNGNYAERTGFGALRSSFFSSSGNDVTTIQACVDFAKANGFKKIDITSGSFSLPAGTETVSEYGVRVHGDPVFDVQGLYAIMLDGLEGVEIDATGSTFTTDTGCPFVGYRCLDCTFKGGSFVTTGLEADVITDEAAAVTWTRSINCRGKRIVVDGYYRNLYAYRAPMCGFDDWCQSINALYYNYYQASVLDITLSREPEETEHFTLGVYAKGGRFGNYFGDQGTFFMCQSEDCLPSGNSCSHFKTERGDYRVLSCKVRESSTQNSGDTINGITAVRTQAVTADLVGVSVQDNDVEGCYKSYFMAGLDGFTFTGNKARNYYQTGFAFISQDVGGTLYNLLNGTISGNECGAMNDSSTRVNTGNDKNCGLQLEENNSLAFDNLVVSGNTVDALGSNATKTPTRGVYIEATNGSIDFGNNAFAEDVTNTIPSWVYNRRVTKLADVITSSGSSSSPTPLDRRYVFSGSARLFNSYIELPDAELGMEVLISATSSTVYIYVNGANGTTTGSNTIYLSGGSSTQKNIQFSGPGTVTLTCTATGQWSAAPDGGTSVTVVT